MRKILLLFSLTASAALAQNYRVDWWVVSSGGAAVQSSGYRVDGSAGQSVVGRTSSEYFMVEAGFWVGLAGRQCEYFPGDANGSGQFNGVDVTFSVSYFKGMGDPPPDTCECDPHGVIFSAADANGSCVFNGIDVTYSVSHLKGLGPPPLGCVDCLPADMPISASMDLSTPGVIQKPLGRMGDLR
jgi:hypothetical protein